MQDRESLECCKQSLMSDFDQISENEDVDKDEDIKSQVYEVSVENKDMLAVGLESMCLILW